MRITAKTKICMVIGDPIEHSFSPQMHNAGYKALHIDNQYVYIACRVSIHTIDSFIKGAKATNIHGISCTMPHKIAVMPYLDEIDKVAKKIGAVNTIINNDGKLVGYNTDWLGVLTPLEKLTSLQNKKVALIGAGGAARAVAYAITNKGAKLLIFNRTIDKAKTLAEEFGGTAYPLNAAEIINNADIIINTTSVGLHDKKETPLPQKYITKNHIIFDVIYGHETRLLKEAKKQGAQIIQGREMLLYQGLAQFKLYTGHDAPETVMRKVLL
ncbi:MAG TPA: shikimate dehydrogenase [Candidatus Sulfotelmatobacter sp.]|jgi:shikimate dehydrogenase|nr:shikimate dehydrogenase [Candidatus Sulfotelmatobacter sp.]